MFYNVAYGSNSCPQACNTPPLTSTAAQSSFLLFKQQFEAMAAYDHELRNTIDTIRLIKAHPSLTEQIKGMWQQVEFVCLNRLMHHRVETIHFYQAAQNDCRETLPEPQAHTPPSKNYHEEALVNRETHTPPPRNTPAPLPLAQKASATICTCWEEAKKLELLAIAAISASTSHSKIARQASLSFKPITLGAIKMELKRITGIFEDRGSSQTNHQFSYLRDHPERCKTLVAAIKKYIEEKGGIPAAKEENGPTERQKAFIIEVVSSIQQINLKADTEDEGTRSTKIAFSTALALFSLAIGLATEENSKLVVKYALNSNKSTQEAVDYINSRSNSTPKFLKKDQDRLELFAKYVEAFQDEKLTPKDFKAKFSNDDSQSAEIREMATVGIIGNLLGTLPRDQPEVDYLRENKAEREQLLAEMNALIEQNNHNVRKILHDFSGKINGHEVKLATRTALYSLAVGIILPECSKLLFRYVPQKRNAPSEKTDSTQNSKKQKTNPLSL